MVYLRTTIHNFADIFLLFELREIGGIIKKKDKIYIFFSIMPLFLSIPSSTIFASQVSGSLTLTSGGESKRTGHLASEDALPHADLIQTNKKIPEFIE